MIRRHWHIVVLVVAFSGVHLLAQTAGAPLPGSVSLDDVLKLLEERSPRTAAERATIAVAEADRVTARTYPNPNVSYGGTRLVSGLSTGAVTQHQLVLEQPLLLFHQRDARLRSADAGVKVEQARVREEMADRRLAVRQAFATLLSRQEQLQIVQDSLTNMDRIQNLVRGRASAGDRSQYDVLRVELETESLRVEAMNASADVDDASGQLAALLGLPGWRPRGVGPLAAGTVSTDVDALWKEAEQRRPSLVALREQQVAARGGLFLAQRERLPVPAVSGGVQTTHDVTGTSAFFGFSMPLNLFDRNQGAIAKAAAQVDAVGLEIQAGLDEARAEVEHAALVLDKRREAMRTFEGTVSQRVPMLRRMAEAAYQEGSADILELLDANRSLKDYELTRVQQLEAVKLAEESVVSAAGLDETEVSK